VDFEERRWRPGQMMGVILTDRCPVGCNHCSVSALMENAGPDSNPDFAAHMAQLAALRDIEVVFITGGDPFVHLDELEDSVAALVAAGKRVVLHSAGYWGADPAIESRARAVLDRIDTLVLGVDLYHRIGVTDEALVGAAGSSPRSSSAQASPTTAGTPCACSKRPSGRNGSETQRSPRTRRCRSAARRD
jgi:hypothetical protein